MRTAMRLCLSGGLAVLALLISATLSSAATPGKIVFHSDRVAQARNDLWTMNGDGSGLLDITNTTTFQERDPTWSPDGRQIAFWSDRDGNSEIWVANADGSSPHQITHFDNAAGGGAGFPQWAPDGRTLVFSGIPVGDTTDDLFLINTDGSGLRQITHTPAGGQDFFYVPAISPDGQWIAFTHQRPGIQDDSLSLIRPDGTDLRSLTSFDGYDPSFTADGKRILFDSSGNPLGTNADGNNEVFSIGVDGTGLRQVTMTAAPVSYLAPGASRDGLNRIAVSSTGDTEHNPEIFAMNADGSGSIQLTHDAAGDNNRNPDWQPNVVCRGRVATIVGTSASETLTGGPGPDIISGQGGKDTIKGLGGKDVICGDAGKDKLVGGKGRDQLDGGKGNDKLTGGKGKDTCVGGKGKHDSGKSCEKEKKIP